MLGELHSFLLPASHLMRMLTNTISPGRFFVAHEFKIILAYLLHNYELKPMDEKPKGMWIGGTVVPPVQVKIEIKRRKGTV